MPVTPFPMMTDVKLVLPSKADLPMLVTLSGMVIDINPVHPENADSPMLVTLSGIVTLFILGELDE